MSAYLARLISGRTYTLAARDRQAARAPSCRRRWRSGALRAEEYARGLLTGGTLFEELGFYYVGPIDGHNLDHLLPGAEERARRQDRARSWSMSCTQKGKGYAPAEKSADKYHGVVKFDVVTGAQAKAQVERARLHRRCSARA